MTRQYPITGYGATPDAGTLQTKFIQSAIDRCFSDGGGEVVIPRGTFMSGDIRLRDHVTLRLLSGAVLLGSRDPMDYFNHRSDTLQPIDKAEMTDRRFVSFHTIENNTSYDPTRVEYECVRRQSSRWNNALIRAINAEDVAVIGEKDSIIDGADCFDPEGEEDYRGPHGITFHDCKNVRFEGYTIRNTGNWAHNLNRCENVTMENVTVLAGHDGIHMSVCRNIRISDSDFRTGDDCIAGFANVNTLVERCHINSSCSAFRFGGTNMLVRDCEVCGPGEYGFRGALSREEKAASAPSPKEGGRRNMLSAFTYYADYSLPIEERPGNIVVESCRFRNVDRFLHYNYSGNETWQKHRPLSSITFADIDAEGVRMPLTAYGDKDDKLTMTLRNVRVRFSERPESFLRLCNHDRVLLENVSVCGIGKDGALIEEWSDGGVVLRNVASDAGEEIRRTDREFVCRAI